MSSNRINVNLAFNAETGKAKKQIQELLTLLNKIAYSGTTAGSGDKVAADLRQAAEAAKLLLYHLNNAFNVKTGNFDLSLLDRSLKSSKANITDLSRLLLKAGKTGKLAFLGLALSISLADLPMLKISNRLKDLGVSLKNAIKWQLSSSIVHGFMGAILSAYGYAQDLNESLNNIRIVTGYNVDRMAEFADLANKAAKALSTTTTEYTDASLIYFQLGLSDADVKKRTDTTIKLANVTGLSVEETANQMTAIWNNFDDGSKSLDYYADVITALGAATASSSKEISEGLNKFSAVAESVGLSYEYASAALATVTATTRQSADIVGNAFKTLFARIQGLKLGETLDDGTTLNKYSEALYNVGIDIKDLSGLLKDMNTILNEMGSKWETLGKDQLIALAQTVAGVRQYTQLIALMDNWDFFLENLGTALGSEGALTEQADIFELGWKASIKRVEAAKEAVFKDLIDENFFIGINNGLTNLLTGIDAFIDKFGGIKSIILSISSIIISSFANKIPEALLTAKYNLFVLFGDTNKAYKEISNNVNQVSNEMFLLYEQTKGLQGIDPESYMGKSIQYANELTIAKNKLALVDDKLSASEKLSYQSTLSIIENFLQETLALEKNNEELKKSIELLEKLIQTKAKNSITSSMRKVSTDWDFSKLNLKDANKEIEELKNSFSKAKDSIVKDSNAIIKEMIEISKTGESKKPNIELDFSELKNTIVQFKNSLDFKNIDSSGLNAIKSFISSISNSIHPVIQEAIGLKTIFDLLLNTNDPGVLNKTLLNLITKLDTASIEALDVNLVLTNLSQTDLNKLIETYDIWKTLGDEVKETTSTIKELLDSFNPLHTVRITEALGSLAGLAGNIVSVGRGISSIADAAFGDNDLSIWERFSSILFGISTIIPGISAGLKSYNTIVDFLTKSKKAETTAEIASNALKKISNTLTTKEITSALAQIYYDKMSTALTKNKKTLRGENLLLKKAEILVLQGAIREDLKQLFLQKLLILTEKGETKAIQKAILEINAETIAREANNKLKAASNTLTKTGNIIGLVAIGLITAAVAAYSAYKEYQKKIIELKKEEIEKLKEENQERKEEIKLNNELIESYNSLIASYEEMKEAVDNGTASHSDLLEVLNNLKDKALEVAEALGVEGAAFAALTGNYDELNKAITKALTELVFEAYQKENTLLNKQSYLYDLDKSYSPMTLYGDESLGLWEASERYDIENVKKSYGEVFAFDFNENKEDLLKSLEEIIKNKELNLLSVNEVDDLVGEAKDNSLKSQMEVYGLFKELYEALLDDKYYEKFKNTDEFALINEYLNKFKDTYNDYIETVKRMSEYDVELAAFSDAGDITEIDFNNLKDPFSKITSIQKFDDYADTMSKTLARWRGVKQEDLTAMASLLKESRTYLGQLEGLGGFKNISDSLDTVADKLGKTKKEVIGLYDNLTEEQKTFFFDVKFDLYKSKTTIENQIAFLLKIAENSSIKLKIDLISLGEELITNDKTTTKDLIAWWNLLKDLKFEGNVKLPDTVEEFLALTQDEQLLLLKTLNKLVIPEKLEDINTDINSIEKKLEENEQRKISVDNGIKRIEEKYFSKEKALSIIDGKVEGVSEQDKFIAKLLLDLYNKADTLVGEETKLNEIKKSLEAEQEALDYTWRETLQKEAESLDIDYNKVKEYALYLREIDVVEANNYQGSEEMALARLKQQQAMEDLTKSSENYLKVLKQLPDTVDENTALNSELKLTINELAESLVNLTGLERGIFTTDFITSNKGNIISTLEALRDGAKGAAEQLAILLMMLVNSNNRDATHFGGTLLDANKNVNVGEKAIGNIASNLKQAYNELAKDNKELANDMLELAGWIYDETTKVFTRTSESAGLELWQIDLKDVADSFGVSYDSVKKNAEILRTLYPELKNNEELSERMALAELAQSEAVKDLTDNYEDYINVLNTAEKGSAEYLQAYQALTNDLSKITGITDTDILDSLINNKDIKDALAKVALGDEGSITELRIAVATEYFIDTDNIDTETILENLELFKALNLNIPVGIELSDELDDPLENIYDNLKEAINEEELKTFFNNILGYTFIDNGKDVAFTKIVGDMTQSIKDLAEAFDINYKEILDYAKILRENNEALKDLIELSEKIALAEKKLAKGADDLIDNYKDYAKVLKEAKLNKEIKSTIEYSKAITNLRKDLSLLTGYKEDIFTDDFINSDEVLQALLDISNGVEGATERLKVLAAAQEIKIKAGIEIDLANLDALLAEITNLNNQDIEIGAIVDEAPALDSLANLLELAGWTTSLIQDFFNNLGWQPEISYEEVQVKDLSSHASGGYVEVVEGNPYEGYKIVSKPVSAFSEMKLDEWVKIPKIGSKSLGGGGYKKVDPIGNSSSKIPSSSGGGGGGSAPKYAEKKNDSDKTRYHTLQNQLEDLKAEYDSISEAADRAFGKDKLKAIDSEISKTDELINKQKEYVDAIKANLPVDKAVMDAYYTDLIGGNIQYDERGNISNYDAIQDAMFNKYNLMTDRYDEDSQEWQVFEKKYEQLEKYIELYEETYDLLRDEEEAYQDLLRQRIDLKLEKILYSVEVLLEIPDNEIAVLEYKLGKIEDDAFKSAEAIGLLTREAEAVYDLIQINKQGLNDVLKLSLSTLEILLLMSGDTSVLANKTFTEGLIDAIKEYRDSLLDLNGLFDDMRKTIEEKVMEVFDAWNEKLDSGISKLDHYGNIIQSYKNIIDIVGKDTLGLTDTFMATLNQSSIDNAINKLSSTKKSYEVMIDAQSKAELALEEAKARNDESSIKMWEENLQSITEEAESAREEMLSAWEEALNGVAELFEATVERAVDIFNKEVYTLGGLEGLSEDFSNLQEKADIMLDDYLKIYELSKLNRDINKSINDIDSLSGKLKLKKLLELINALQEDGLEMSQYDLEYLQKTYDLRMAEIELEEARNAKNTVRLRKDNEGNWSYVYTQNMDAVDTALQKYEDALYAMLEVSSNYIDEMSEKLISTSLDMEEALAAIRIQDFASIDDYYAEVQRVQLQYEEELSMQQNELQKAIDNNKILYDLDWTNYHNATGYKISDTENFATTFRDTLLGSLLGSEEDTANFTDIIGSAVNTLTQGLMTGAEIYYANLEAAMNAAGTSTGNFAEDTAANIDAVVEKSIEGAEAVDLMAIEMIDAFSEITNSVLNWQESYGTAMLAIIDSNLAVIESFNQMLEALSIDPNSITVRYDLINSNNAPLQFASGGYTGEWGNYGKLAILDEKELILNQNDTTNFLKALGIAQTILDTIDLNATQASYGFGNLVPATINENNSQTIELDVHITAEFPNATDKNEIELAFETLINKASLYANRR